MFVVVLYLIDYFLCLCLFTSLFKIKQKMSVQTVKNFPEFHVTFHNLSSYQTALVSPVYFLQNVRCTLTHSHRKSVNIIFLTFKRYVSYDFLNSHSFDNSAVTSCIASRHAGVISRYNASRLRRRHCVPGYPRCFEVRDKRYALLL